MLHNILLVILIVVCIINTVVILAQEGNESSLGSISGSLQNSYVKKNEKRSAKYRMKMATIVLSALSLVLVIALFLV